MTLGFLDRFRQRTTPAVPLVNQGPSQVRAYWEALRQADALCGAGAGRGLYRPDHRRDRSWVGPGQCRSCHRAADPAAAETRRRLPSTAGCGWDGPWHPCLQAAGSGAAERVGGAAADGLCVPRACGQRATDRCSGPPASGTFRRVTRKAGRITCRPSSMSGRSLRGRRVARLHAARTTPRPPGTPVPATGRRSGADHKPCGSGRRDSRR